MDASQVGNAYEHALRELATAQAENARLTSEVARLREDAARLDRLELTIRDGSFASILNDIIAFCQVAYKGIGPGPALRTAIDATLPDAKPAPAEFYNPAID